MKKILELLRLPACKGDLGVEIECEGNNLNPIDTPSWRTERDGSLRGDYPYNSSEYVMRAPVTAKRFPSVLKELIDHQKNAKFNFSFRTSVHVHVNVQELTEDELLAFLYACMLLEEPLMNFCGESRKGNRFCLRMNDAEGYDKTLSSIFTHGYRAIARLNGDKIRYSAINVHSLVKYGSIEFRGMRGNMEEAVLLPWCSTLLSIRNVAKKLKNPINVYNMYVGMGNQEFAKKFFGKHADLFMYEGMERDMNQSFSLTIELPHMYKTRDKVKDEYPVEDAALQIKPPIGAVRWGAARFIVDREDQVAVNPAPIPQPAPIEAIESIHTFNQIHPISTEKQRLSYGAKAFYGVAFKLQLAEYITYYINTRKEYV